MSEREPKRVRVRSRRDIDKLSVNVVYCGRPSEYGNPYYPKDYIDAAIKLSGGTCFDMKFIRIVARQLCIKDYITYLNAKPELKAKMRRELEGKDLACYCGLEDACHVDVILEVANE